MRDQPRGQLPFSARHRPKAPPTTSYGMCAVLRRCASAALCLCTTARERDKRSWLTPLTRAYCGAAAAASDKYVIVHEPHRKPATGREVRIQRTDVSRAYAGAAERAREENKEYQLASLALWRRYLEA